MNEMNTLGSGGGVSLVVRGSTPVSVGDIVGFLSRNARVTLRNARSENEYSVVGTVTPREAQEAQRWNGARLGQATLRFESATQSNTQSNGSTSQTIGLLKAFLVRRYDPQARMLNLGSLHADQELVQRGLFSSISTQHKMFPALMKLASQDPQFDVRSINLADNNLRDVTGVASLAQSFPKLENLCLANNKITNTRSMETWKHKFKDLRELLMANNPVTQNSNYRQEMLRLFPKLVILDNVIVRDAQKLAQIYRLPFDLKQFFFESEQLGSSSTDFVANFLQFWDGDRTQLLPLYTPQSQFSVSIDSTVPNSTVPEADQTPSFGYYLPISRNITRVSSEKSIKTRLALGPEAINEKFRSLPRTKHLLQERPMDYAIECISFPQVNGFMVTLHGYFEEVAKPDLDTATISASGGGSFKKNRRGANSNYASNNKNRLSKKSFDRTWVIVPMNNTLVVASDLLVIRAFAANPWSQPCPSPVTPGIPMPSASIADIPKLQQAVPVPSPMATTLPQTLQLPPEVQANLNPLQLDLLGKLHLQTKLNAEYTYMLAEQSGWNYDTAMKNFQSSVGNLPPNVFIAF